MRIKKGSQAANELGAKPTKWKRRIGIMLPILLLMAGIYLLSLVFAPKLVPYFKAGSVQKSLDSNLPQKGNDRLYIKELGVNAPIKAGSAATMNNGGVWHRFPERGNPVEGGNFILSAHRWHTGKTPAETIAQSPFYNMDRVKVGDSIVVDYDGLRYRYEVFEIFGIKPDQTEIEDELPAGEQPYMTLYTCTLKGASDGRVVIRARLKTT